MKFIGVSKEFSLISEEQYNTIGAFWDEMAELYGLENLQGLGYNWNGPIMSYAIGLKNGIIENYNVCIDLPDTNWIVVNGKTDDLKIIYDEIYKSGPLQYEIETFDLNENCKIKFIRKK